MRNGRADVDGLAEVLGDAAAVAHRGREVVDAADRAGLARRR